MRLSLPLFSAWILIAPIGCSPPDDLGQSAQAPSDDAPKAPSNRIAIPPTVQRNLGIRFARVEVRHVAETMRFPGAFELQPRARREYRMPLAGHVQLLVDQYETVEVGTPLFRYKSPTWPELLHEIILGEQAIESAQAEIRVAQAKREEAHANLELVRRRLDTLAVLELKRAELDAQAVQLEASLPRLQAELAQARTRLSNAERTREHALHRAATATGIAESELETKVSSGEKLVPRYATLDWIEVSALEAGVVEELALTDGSFAEVPARVLTVMDPNRSRFRARALQADLPKLLDQQTARIVAPTSSSTDKPATAPAIVTVGLEAHPHERTIDLIAIPAGEASWIRPGISAFLEVVVDSTQAPALAIPRSAVVQDGLNHVFFRRDPADPNQVIRVEADLGVSDGLWVVVQSGVMRGDEVVLAGAYELQLASQRGGASGQGGHFHADGSFHGDH